MSTMVNGQRTFSVAYCVGMKKVRGRGRGRVWVRGRGRVKGRVRGRVWVRVLVGSAPSASPTASG